MSKPDSKRWLRVWVPLAVGDVLVLTAFLAYGLWLHAVSPIQFPLHTLLTALPFLLAWALLAPLFGLYRRRTIRSLRRTVLLTTLAWIAVSVLGSGIRATSFFHGGSPPEFLLVTVAFGLVFIVPWRIAVTVAEHVRHNPHIGILRSPRRE